MLEAVTRKFFGDLHISCTLGSFVILDEVCIYGIKYKYLG